MKQFLYGSLFLNRNDRSVKRIAYSVSIFTRCFSGKFNSQQLVHPFSHESFRGLSLTFRSKIAKMIEYNDIGEAFRVEVEYDEKFTGK